MLLRDVRIEWLIIQYYYYLVTHVRKYPDDSRTRRESELAVNRSQTRRRVQQKLRDKFALFKCNSAVFLLL